MTDVRAAFQGETPVHGRMGVSARIEDDELVLQVEPDEHLLVHGVLRTSVLAYLVDALAGIPVDIGIDDWMLTTDLSIRSVPEPAPPRVVGRSSVLRRGRRSSASLVELTADDGTTWGTGAAGFARVTRKPDDPPKPMVTLELIAEGLRADTRLDDPLREAAGIRTVDARDGVVEMEIGPLVQNPAGTLQGAMVALVAEAAAEDLVTTRTGTPVVVTDLDIRYLARTGAGPIRSRARPISDGPDAAIEVVLVDTSTDAITTFVYARTVSV
ncbi:MAG: hypothetical protein U5K30_10625 [Acidimicrobiales bacterium]|nr:hypothetical protein [Acidimicrobiales bacterium]